MSNRNPDTSGIDRKWRPGEDDRIAVWRRADGATTRVVDEVLDALWKTILERRRTKIIGVGVFEWKPWNNRLPTGDRVSSWRLVFKPSRYAGRYNGKGK